MSSEALEPPSSEVVARAVFTQPLLRNAGVLFAGQVLGLVVPLLTIPYLSRVLGPKAWGPLLAAQGLGNWMVMVLEFGFDLSGTRAIARARSTPHLLGEIVHGTQSAKAVLASAIALMMLLVLLAIPSLRQQPELIGWTFVFVVLRGFSPLWYFQGIERMRRAVAIDALSRAAAALGVFVVVHDGSDAWRVIALQALFGGFSLLALTVWLSQQVQLRLPNARAGIKTIRENWTPFACRASSGLYMQANTSILSAFAQPATVGFFGGAERIIRAAINLLQPLTQAIFPRLSHLQATDPAAARRSVRVSIVGVGLVGVALSAIAIIGAPLLVRVLLGRDYSAAIPLLRLLGVLPCLVAVNTVLGLYWALPFGHDRLFLNAIIWAGVANVGLAFSLVPRWGAFGMAAAAISAEVVVMAVLTTGYLGRKL